MKLLSIMLHWLLASAQDPTGTWEPYQDCGRMNRNVNVNTLITYYHRQGTSNVALVEGTIDTEKTWQVQTEQDCLNSAWRVPVITGAEGGEKMCIVYETNEDGVNSACYAFFDAENIFYGAEVRYCIPEGSALGREVFSTSVIEISENTMSNWEAYMDGCSTRDSSQPVPEDPAEEEDEVVEEGEET